MGILIGGLLALGAAVAGTMVSKLVRHLYNSVNAEYMSFNIVLFGGTAIALAFYFARWESGSGRATLGKWTFGMLVLKDDNEPVSFKLAIKRFAMSLVSVLSLSGTFVMCFFRSDHRALHDLATKTKVVWRGDENL
ncbi:MAG: RDD family protein [Fuerstiella sp.]|nr:RDD family protein [Fuerstiella sp.]